LRSRVARELANFEQQSDVIISNRMTDASTDLVDNA
jgi:hypothetical protein